MKFTQSTVKQSLPGGPTSGTPRRCGRILRTIERSVLSASSVAMCLPPATTCASMPIARKPTSYAFQAESGRWWGLSKASFAQWHRLYRRWVWQPPPLKRSNRCKPPAVGECHRRHAQAEALAAVSA